MAIIDKDFNKWIASFRGLNPDLFTGKHGLSERMADSIAQIAFAAGKAAVRSQATTAAGLVDDAMVKRALNAQPFVAENVATRVWELITGGVTNSERAMRAALEAALGREVGP